MFITEHLSIAIGSVLAAVGASVIAWYSSRTRAGRLTRTLDQVARVCDMVERWTKIDDSFSSLQPDDDAKRLMQSCLRAVLEDFQQERQVLPQFQASTSSVRRLLLLSVSSHPAQWPFQIMFHSLLLLVIVVVSVRIAYSEWSLSDTVVVFFCLVSAVVVRALVHMLQRRVH